MNDEWQQESQFCSTFPSSLSSLSLLHERKKNKSGIWKIVRSYEIGATLGKGGFAKVYFAIEVNSREQYAIKVISKASLKRESCMEKTFKELLDNRKNLTEIEIKSHLLQIIESLKYIHSKGIIHRDLKIANIFLNERMIVKIADFGLSGMIKTPTQMRRTVCGTPNYVAPEVLNDEGHDFLVDNWAVGVITYTLLYGKPPFEAKEVQDTLKNIKANRYTFPEKTCASYEITDFISKILVPNPNERLTLDEMLEHPFLSRDPQLIPKYLPTSTLAFPLSTSYLRRLIKPTLEIASSNNSRVLQQSQKSSNIDHSGYLNQVISPAQSVSHSSKRRRIIQSRTQCSTECDILYRGQENDHFSESYQDYILKTEPKTEILQENKRLFQLRSKNQISKPPRYHSQVSESKTPSCQRDYQTHHQTFQMKSLQHSRNTLKGSTLSTNQDSDPDFKSSNLRIQTEINQTSNTYHQQQHLRQQDNLDNNRFDTFLAQEKVVILLDYLDCRSEFGVSYYLSNGTVGIILNNQKIVQLIDGYFILIETDKTSTRLNIKDQTSREKLNLYEEYPRLIKLILNLQDYFLHKYQKGKHLTNLSQANNFGKEISIKQFIFTKQAALFKFSNKFLQGIFTDHSIVVMSNKNIFFKDKRGVQSLFSFRESENHHFPLNLQKRVNYINEIFQEKLEIKLERLDLIGDSRNININIRSNTNSRPVTSIKSRQLSPLIGKTSSSNFFQSSLNYPISNPLQQSTIVTNENINYCYILRPHSIHYPCSSPSHLSYHSSKPQTFLKNSWDFSHKEPTCCEKDKQQQLYRLRTSNRPNIGNKKDNRNNLNSCQCSPHRVGLNQLGYSMQKFLNNHKNNLLQKLTLK